jgi:hypothetical protein
MAVPPERLNTVGGRFAWETDDIPPPLSPSVMAGRVPAICRGTGAGGDEPGHDGVSAAGKLNSNGG